MILGLDVSVYQSPTPDLTGYDFLIARACYGTLFDNWYYATDKTTGKRYVVRGDGQTFKNHIANAKATGLLTGAYCFGRKAEDPEAQAHTLLDMAGDVDFLVLDVEADGTTPEMTADQCRAFLAYCKANDPLGRKVALYHSRSGFPPDAYGFDIRWVADYGMNTGQPGKPPAIPWDLWQYTSNPLDKNIYPGTRDELAALVGAKEDSMTKVRFRPDTNWGTATLPAGHQLISAANVLDRFPSAGALYDFDQPGLAVLGPLDLLGNNEAGMDILTNQPPQVQTVVALVQGSAFGAAALAVWADLTDFVPALGQVPPVQPPVIDIEVVRKQERQRIAAAEAARINAI